MSVLTEKELSLLTTGLSYVLQDFNSALGDREVGAKLRFEFVVSFDQQDYITICLAQEGGTSYGFNRCEVLGLMYSGMQDSAMVQLLRSLYEKYLTFSVTGTCIVGEGRVMDLVVEGEEYFFSYPE